MSWEALHQHGHRRPLPARAGRKAHAVSFCLIKSCRDHRNSDLIDKTLIDRGSKYDIGVRIDCGSNLLGRFINLCHREVASSGDIKEDSLGAFDGNFQKRRRNGGPGRRRARFSPTPVPMPMSELPALVMIDRTSAKSTLMSPGIVMRSDIPCTPWESTESATRNASRSVIFLSMTSSNR